MSIKNQQAGAGEQDRTDEPAIGEAIGQTIGQTSGQHQGLHHPDEDQRVKQALDDADLADLGESAEDQLRDRGGRGLPNDVSSDSDEAEPDEGR